MLETIREYALERLLASGDEPALRKRHATYFLRFFADANREFSLGETAQWLAHLDPEHDNVRSALEWARDCDDHELLVRLTAEIGEYWRYSGLNSEARTWLATALERAESPSEARTNVLEAAVKRAFEDGDVARMTELVAEFRSAAEDAGDNARLLEAMGQSARLDIVRGHFDAARERLVELKKLAGELGDLQVEAKATNNLGALAINAREYRAALEYATEAAALFRETGDEGGVSTALVNCGWCAFALGDADGSAGWFREALLIAIRLGSPPKIADGLQGLAAALIAGSDARRGAQLLGAASALREQLEMRFRDASEEEDHQRAVADAKAALGEDGFAAAWAQGESLTREEIVDLAGVPRPDRG